MSRKLVVLAGTAVIVVAASTTAAVPPVDGAPASWARLRPPIPRVNTLGTTRRATLVSYCWQKQFPGGQGEGVCADGAPGHPAHTLRWRPGTEVRVDLRLPAKAVQAQAMRFAGAVGSQPNDIVRLKLVAIDQTGRRWMLRLPRRATRDTDLLIAAYFTNGDIEADLGIRRAIYDARSAD